MVAGNGLLISSLWQVIIPLYATMDAVHVFDVFYFLHVLIKKNVHACKQSYIRTNAILSAPEVRYHGY